MSNYEKAGYTTQHISDSADGECIEGQSSDDKIEKETTIHVEANNEYFNRDAREIFCTNEDEILSIIYERSNEDGILGSLDLMVYLHSNGSNHGENLGQNFGDEESNRGDYLDGNDRVVNGDDYLDSNNNEEGTTLYGCLSSIYALFSSQ